MSDDIAPASPRWWNTKIIVSAVVLAISVSFTVLAFALPSSHRGQPGAGLFPQILGSAWVIFALINLVLDVTAVFRPARKPVAVAAEESEIVDPFAEDVSKIEPRTVLYMMGLSVLYVALFLPLGGLLSSILFGAAGTYLIKRNDRKRTMASIVLFTIVMVVVIKVALQQDLPEGVLGFIPFI